LLNFIVASKFGHKDIEAVEEELEIDVLDRKVLIDENDRVID
jgi:hypothetical protein